MSNNLLILCLPSCFCYFQPPSQNNVAKINEWVSRADLIIDRSASFQYLRLASANMWLFEGMARSVIEKKPEGYAMMHNTIVPPIIEGGIKENVIPTIAKAIVNTRILSGENSKTVEEYIGKTIGDERVIIKKMGDMNKSGVGSSKAGVRSFPGSRLRTPDSRLLLYSSFYIFHFTPAPLPLRPN